MRVDVVKIIKAHGWKILYTTVSIVATCIGGTYAYAVSQTTSNFTTQSDIADLQHRTASIERRQDALDKDVHSIKEGNSRVEGKVDTMLDLLQRRRP